VSSKVISWAMATSLFFASLPLAAAAQAEAAPPIETLMFVRHGEEPEQDLGPLTFSVARLDALAADIVAQDAAANGASAWVAPDFRQFPRVLGWDFTRGLFSTDNILPLAAGATGALIVSNWDEEISSDGSWRRGRFVRRSGAEKLEMIRLVEESDLPVRSTLWQLGIAPSTFYGWYQRYLVETGHAPLRRFQPTLARTLLLRQ